MINLDPSLAFTAIIELRPGLEDPRGEIRSALAAAMTAANPANRWEFARAWLDYHHPLPRLLGPVCPVYCTHGYCMALTDERNDHARAQVIGARWGVL